MNSTKAGLSTLPTKDRVEIWSVVYYWRRVCSLCGEITGKGPYAVKAIAAKLIKTKNNIKRIIYKIIGFQLLNFFKINKQI